jgi:hypothetical protein
MTLEQHGGKVPRNEIFEVASAYYRCTARKTCSM